MTDDMIAAVLHEYGQPLRVSRVDRPQLRPGHALVRVEASGVNPLDAKIQAGAADHARAQLPAILGIDLAGTIESVADDVNEFVPGDAVYGMTGGVAGVAGSLAQYAVVDARLIARRPRSWTARQAAATPLAAITAWEALVDRAGVHKGQTVLVHGGAGGVGYLGVQLSRALGADVFATASGSGLAVVAACGATAIDYTTTEPAAYVEQATGGQGFDVIFDTVGGATLDASFASVRMYTGHVVSALGWGTHSLAPLSFRGASYSGVFTLLPLITGAGREHHGDILRRVTDLAEAGRLAPRLDPRSFTLDTVHEAHAVVRDGAARGKVVIDVT